MKKTLLRLSLIAVLALGMIFLMSTTSVRSARLTSYLTVYENLVTQTTSTYIEINGLNEVVNYAPGGLRNDADKVYAKSYLGDGTIDLTNLTNTLGEALNLTGQVVVACKFQLADSSGDNVVISQGATNPYPLFGATYSFTLYANQSLLFKADTVLIPISATAKTIAYNSSGTDIPLKIILITADGYE